MTEKDSGDAAGGTIGTSIRIGVVDNDPYALKVLSAMIGQLDPGFTVMWTTELGAVAIGRCLRPATRPDVLVTDMSMRDVSGTEVCRAIRTKTPDVGLVGITSYALSSFSDEVARCGAQALVAKTDVRSLAEAIRAAAEGKALGGETFHSAIETHLALEDESLASGARTGALSAKERETLRRYADGLDTHQIADELGVSPATIATFERRALAKLGARSRAHAIAICVKRHEF